MPKKSFDLLGRTESLANDDFSVHGPAILNDNISRKIPDGSRISYYREFLNARSEGFSLKKCPGNTVQHAYTIGAFHSTRTFQTLETAANGTDISRKSFRNPGNG